MNHVYRLVWNHSLGVLVAVAENAGGASAKSTPRQRSGRAAAGAHHTARARLAAMLVLVTGLIPTAALALPAGERVVSGQVSVHRSADSVTVDQASRKAILNWQRFDIGPRQTVTFHQPDAASAALNRVVGGEPSAIYGHLNANGQLFLVNPNGVYFAPGAQVNVGGLVASTLNISNQDFLHERYRFAGSSAAGVVNEGRISSANGGYIAFIGHRVSNRGTITTPGGTTALGAGGRVDLTLAGNRLLSFQVSAGALQAAADNGGLIQADGGRVIMSAHAKDAVLRTVVNNTGVVRARGVAQHGGVIVLEGGDSGATKVAGTLDARPNDGGPPGFIETSGRHLEFSRADIQAGAGGRWLVDPVSLTIDSAAATTINNTLAGGTSVTEQTTATAASGAGNQTSGVGDINVDAPISWSTDADLTLSAFHSINVNAPIAATGANPGLTLTFNNDLGGTSSGGALNLNHVAVTLSGSNPGLSINGIAYTVINSMAALQNIQSGLSGHYALGSDLTDTTTSGSGFSPIGSDSTTFSGVFDGLNHTITGLYINRGSADGVGLFGYVSGTIRNVGLVGGSISGDKVVGALVGSNVSGVITNAYATSSVSAADDDVGGLVGVNAGSINDSYATGDVHGGDDHVGGLVGSNQGVINGCYASGEVTASDNEAGGLVGSNYLGTVSNSYATGRVSGHWNVGGLIGSNFAGTVNDVYATGFVDGGNDVGGLIGDNSGGSNRHAYWSKASSGQSQGVGSGAADGVIGLNSNQIKQRSSFSGFDFYSPVWVIYEGHTAPLLNAFLTPLTVTAGNITRTYSGDGTNASLIDPTYSIPNAPSSGHLFGTNNPYSYAVDAGTYTPDLWSDQQGYRISYSGARLDIAQKALTVSGVTATDKVYDGTIADDLDTSSAMLSGVISGDPVSVGNGAGAATFASADVGNGIGVSAHLTLTGSEAGNYTLTQPTGLSAAITPRTLTAAIVGNPSKTYDATTAATLAPGNYQLGGFASGQGARITQSQASYARADAGSGIGVSTALDSSDFAADSGTALSNYELPIQATGTGAITPKALTVSGIAAIDKVYDGTAADDLNLSGASLDGVIGGDTVSLGSGSDAGTFASADAGNGIGVIAHLSLSGSAAGNYTLSQPTGLSADITPKALMVSGMAATDKTYDATTSDNLDTSGAALSGVISGDAVNLGSGADAGTFASANASDAISVSAHLSLSGSAAGNYTLSQPTGLSADITPKALTVSRVAATDKVYDATTGDDLDTGSAILSGVVGGDAVNLGSGTDAGIFASANVGNAIGVSAHLGLSGSAAGNYTLTQPGGLSGNITPKALTVSGVTATDKVYDGTTDDDLDLSGASLDGVISGDTVSLGSGMDAGTFASADAGNNISVTSYLALSGAQAGNYTLTQPGGLTANIDPKAVTVSNVTATDKAYDGTTADDLNLNNASLNGVISGDTVSLSSGADAGTFASADAGNNINVTPHLALSGGQAGNYTLTQPVGLNATIDPKALTVSDVAATNKTYDGTTADDLNLSGASLDGVIGSDMVSLSSGADAGTFASANAGNNISVSSHLTLSGSQAGNYTLTQPPGLSADIARKGLTVSGVTATNKTYDGTTADDLDLGGASLDGVIGGDTVSLGSGADAGIFASANAGDGIGVSANLTPNGSSASNYTLSQPGGLSADITPKTLTVSDVAATDKTYDGTTSDDLDLSGATLSGLIGGDAVNLDGGTDAGTFASADAGDNISVSSHLMLAGSSAGNYTLTQPTGLSAAITPKALMVSSVTATDKVYDATTGDDLDVSNAMLSGVIGGDAVNLDSGTDAATFASANVGNAIGVSAHLGLSGSAAGNYTLTQPAGLTADIEPKVLSAAIAGNPTKIYDATNAATLAPTDYQLSGFVADQNASVIQSRGTYASLDAGSGINVSATLASGDFVADSGTRLSNYKLPTQAMGAGTITPKALTAGGVNATDKVQDATGRDDPDLSNTAWSVNDGDAAVIRRNPARASTRAALAGRFIQTGERVATNTSSASLDISNVEQFAGHENSALPVKLRVSYQGVHAWDISCNGDVTLDPFALSNSLVSLCGGPK